jgi:hypothetical protein
MMRSFKDYYDEVLKESFGGYKRPVFGQRGIELPPMGTEQSTRFRRAVTGKYKNGYEYAEDISGRDYSNTDPPALRARIEHEHSRLKSEWEFWRSHGFV